MEKKLVPGMREIKLIPGNVSRACPTCRPDSIGFLPSTPAHT